MSDSVVSSDRFALPTRSTGAGEPVVFVHGSGGDLNSWNAVVEQLADDHTCWTWTRRGYTSTGNRLSRNTFRHEVADLSAVIDVAGSPVHLVGGSYGATVAMHAALEAPTSVRSLAIFEPPLFAAGAGLRPVVERHTRLVAERRFALAAYVFAAQVARAPADLLGPLPGDDVGAEGSAEQADAVGALHDLEALTDDVTDLGRWARLTMPVLLLRGQLTWDPMPATMDALAQHLPVGTEQAVLQGQSHFATHTAPDLFADRLRTFLRAHRAG